MRQATGSLVGGEEITTRLLDQGLGDVRERCLGYGTSGVWGYRASGWGSRGAWTHWFTRAGGTGDWDCCTWDRSNRDRETWNTGDRGTGAWDGSRGAWDRGRDTGAWDARDRDRGAWDGVVISCDTICNAIRGCCWAGVGRGCCWASIGDGCRRV